MYPERLLARFLRYVQIDTTAKEEAGVYPSTPGQLELGRLLVEELRAIGLSDALQTEHGIVLATLPGNSPRNVPTIAFNSHVDTSPETTGRNVRPQVWRNYDGCDLQLPGDSSRVIRTADQPELASLRGRTIITSDGTTLLGADDKAGVAVIMEAVATLAERPALQHGPIRVCFTCDEEIGRGVDFVDLKQLGATVLYTLDGGAQDEIDHETFSADLAVVTILGVNIHPSIAKDRMVNAVRIAGDFLSRLPHDRLAPEVTDGRDGFVHPYRMEGGVAEVQLRILLRDFDAGALFGQAELLRAAAAESERDFPGSSIAVEIRKQYRNMAEGLSKEPRALAYAVEAHRSLGREPKLTIVRGGTDGSRFTELGLPAPNLSCGEHTPHSPLEWACLEEMQAAVEVLVELAQVWERHAG